jgi:thiamine-monophosphate kinase
VSITAFGMVPKGAMVRRSTAKAGDSVVVTGTIGDSALGVRLRREASLVQRWRLTETMLAHLQQRYLLPEPRNALADAVLQYAASAMDVSDGLAGDVAKLGRASGVAAEIDVARVPFSQAARAAIAADPALIETALTGGDDYEIVLTLKPEKLSTFFAAADTAGVAVTEIGRIMAGEGARFIRDGKPLAFERSSYSHF